MKITFIDKKLQKLVNSDRKLFREFGQLRAVKIITRLNQLQDAITLEDVKNLPGNYHELAGNRKGQWACDLDQPYRLIFTSFEKPIPTNKDGQYVWLEIIGVEVIEIVDYHKKK
ncbi:MAG: killer suppression protein HigA [Bacteroidota bacterium]